MIDRTFEGCRFPSRKSQAKVAFDLLPEHRIDDPGEIYFKLGWRYMLGVIMLEPSNVPHLACKLFLDIGGRLYLKMWSEMVSPERNSEGCHRCHKAFIPESFQPTRCCLVPS